MDIVKQRNNSGSLGTLQDQMNDLFGRFFEDWPLSSVERGLGWLPVDLAEDDEQFTVKAELPGLSSDDIDLSVVGDTLTISGNKKVEKEDEGRNYYHVERRYGTFRRGVRLPSTVDGEKVQARYNNGVLTVTLPKADHAKPRRINVKS
jgi:HSP20 family protein